MTDGPWIFIRYRAFYDVPRCLVFNHGGRRRFTVLGNSIEEGLTKLLEGR